MNIGQVLNNLPNLVTLARMLMTPLAVMMIISQRFLPAFLIFIFAGVSDAIDGFIAKNFDLRTEFGAYLDPLADKALLISIYVSLAIYADLPAWIAVTVVSRDVMILSPFWSPGCSTNRSRFALSGCRSSIRSHRSRWQASRLGFAPMASILSPCRHSLNGRSPGQPWPRAASISPSG